MKHHHLVLYLSLEEQYIENIVGRGGLFWFCEFFVKAGQKFMCRERFSLTLSLLIKYFLVFWYQ